LVCRVFTQKQLDNIKDGLIAIYGDNEGEALYNQEYHCSFEGCVPGAYYAKQLTAARSDGRITRVPWQPSQEVDTYWDLGVDDSMTIWFIQHIGMSHHVIDYYENTGFGLEHYAKHLKSLDYVYGNHYMPHDAEQREMTNSEIALTRREVAKNLGIKPTEIVSRVRNIDTMVQVHIPAVRNILGSCWFDEKKCARGISALEGYRAEYDDKKKKLGNRPLHDWCSHGADAFRTFAVGYSKPVVWEQYEEHDESRSMVGGY
jgi:phage terminase large subunit